MAEQLTEGTQDLLNPAFAFTAPNSLSRPPFWYGPKRSSYHTGDKIWFVNETGWHAAVVGNSYPRHDSYIITYSAVPVWSKSSDIKVDYKCTATSADIWPRTDNLCPLS